MKWPMPSGWQFIVYGSFVVALVCIVHSIDVIRFESLFKLDRIPFHQSISEAILGNTPPNSTIFLATTTTEIPKKPQHKIQFPLNCTFGSHLTCPANYYPTSFPSQDDQDSPSTTTTCPNYFRWIYEDLRPWKETGITREMVEERASVESNFRLVILNGRAYIERYRKGFETRDLFTQWGILQLLRRSDQGDDLSVKDERELSWYKIYIEGFGWSVSEKYILACNSVTLLVKPRYYDFFTRGLMPMHHYWPIKEYDQCRSIKFAVEWGNNHEQEAKDIVEAASDFIHEDLKMDYVYDYMFHVLREYAKLLRYKPTIPKKAIEICSETLACPAVGLYNAFMMESMVKGPTDMSPCNMPPPYDPHAFRTLLRSKANSVSLVELWEQRYWENQTKHN
ncbi:hypothetical protein RHGRI_008508 [Rhododendron griersonianum]|uniref:Glycosyl transferase CAP10 domain-containing protein n=1 Tax=Rhododendron griersonianum TaxID=479676 RepID=A0AAV6L0G4_9ERIC|nr:hypothetical protein RHGRI_008508 [Rhododendron griersonianum]